ncbi:TetR/AcrR family transcriptional regulator [Thiolapillus sp.]
MTLSDKALATRERILTAATELFYKNGYHATGLEKVIRQAKVTKGNFYYHFDSKEALAVATLEWQYSRLSEDVAESVLKKKQPPLEKLFSLLDYMVGRQQEQYREGQIRGCYFGNFALEFSTVSSEVRQTVNRIFGSYRQLIESLLKRAQDAGQISPALNVAQFSRMILGQIEGAILLDKAQQEPDYFVHGIRFIKECLVQNQD